VTVELQGALKRSCVIRQEGVGGEGTAVLSTALQSSITVLLHFGGEEALSISPVNYITALSHVCSDTGTEFLNEIILQNCNRPSQVHTNP
jgi:hypothetical protein